MGNTYTPGEIVAFGTQIEKNGRDFYDLASKNVKADRVRQVFEYISNDEQLHIAVVADIVRQIDENPRSSGKLSSEYMEYLTGLAELNPFTQNKQGSEMARNLRNDKQALELALGYEKDSILFYTEIRKLAGGGPTDDIDKLIAGEQDHFRRIAGVLKGFNKFGVGFNKMP